MRTCTSRNRCWQFALLVLISSAASGCSVIQIDVDGCDSCSKWKKFGFVDTLVNGTIPIKFDRLTAPRPQVPLTPPHPRFHLVPTSNVFGMDPPVGSGHPETHTVDQPKNARFATRNLLPEAPAPRLFVEPTEELQRLPVQR